MRRLGKSWDGGACAEGAEPRSTGPFAARRINALDS